MKNLVGKVTIRRGLSFLLSLILVFGSLFGTWTGSMFGGGAEEVYAKEPGQKNKQACDHCEAVRDNEPPEGYTEVVAGKVYSGGNSYSEAAAVSNGPKLKDQDPTDFAKPLPYGNVYIDANRLNWDNPNNFVIDIQDDRFQWVSISDEPLTDAKGKKSTNDPMGVEGAGPLKMDAGIDPMAGIAYVGPLKSYLANMTDTAKEGGYTNVIEPKDGAEYLYRITYLNAVTLPNGTKGNLVLTMNKVQIETSVTIDEDHPYTPEGVDYSYTKAFVKIQGANQLSNDTGHQFNDANGQRVNQQNTRVLTKAEAQVIYDSVNAQLPANKGLSSSWVQDKYARNATGDVLDLDIEVVDSEGKPVEGTISYAAHDMDFESAQSIWGRPAGHEFGEGMTIVSGSQSYALVPDYSHIVNGQKIFYKDDENAISYDTGWVPVGPGQEQLDRPLDITQISSGNHADGIRFASSFIANYRDEDGDFSDAIYSSASATTQGQVVSYQGDGLAANNNIIAKKSGNSVSTGASNAAKKQLYAMMKKQWEANEEQPYVSSWEDVTAELAWEKLGSNYWKTYRNDSDASFDTGFAVLLDSKKTSIQWTGSRAMGANVNTTLFDPTLFTYIEQTHGTGGGIYMETYNLSNDCEPTPMEGVVTMGRGSNATITAVPEDGYRVKTLQIGGAELSEPVTYTINYDENGKAKAILKNSSDESGEGGSSSYNLQNGKATIDGIEFEVNSDGTVDVSFSNLQDPRHVHVDFDADYYFYKVWKGGEPTKLNMTAVPYAYIFTDVTLPLPTGEFDDDNKPIYDEGTHFSIDGTKYTADDGTKYVLNPNNNLETEEKDQATGDPVQTLPYVLKGNSFVLGDKEYPVSVKFGVNFSTASSGKVKFVVDDTSEYSDYVTVLGKDDSANTISPGNTVWKIKYPADGVEELGWPALPIETEPDGHNRNHVERNYWFATEEVQGWSLEGYDNTDAMTPGVVSDEYYDEHVWRAASVKDFDDANEVIHDEFLKKNAYMSVFSKDAGNTTEDTYGGKITNIQPVVVKGTKNWDDLDNAYKIRQDIWLHIDAKINGTVKKDILPPQKVDAAVGSTQTVTWGDKTVYETNQENVEIIHELADIPLKDDSGRRVTYTDNGDGSYTATNGITYWLNELVKVDTEGNVIEYTIRETLDADGDKPVEKSDPELGLIGYTAETDEVAWDNMDKDGKTEIGEGDDKIEVDTYEGELTNELALNDFQITKIWKENGSNHTHTLDADKAKLKAAFTLQENGETWVDSDELPKLQPNVAEEYVADPESGTLEIKNGNDETEVVFIWHNVPYGVADTDDDGNPIVRLAEFSIVETQLNGYEAPEYSDEDKALDEGTITNEVLPPEGNPKETWGEKNKPQTANGKKMFDVTTETDIDGNPNKIEKVELIDPNTGEPATTVTVEGGTYTIDENGIITFMPEQDFVGDPPPVTVRGTDSNGLSAETTYTPHVVETTKKVTRTIVYEYNDGTPVIDESTGEPLTVVQVVEFAGTLNPDTGEVIYPADAEGTMDEVESPDIPTWNYDKELVGEVTVYPTSNDLFEKVIYSPVGIKPTADVTYGLPNETQTGEPKFEMEDGSEGEITVKLIDPHSGEAVDEDTVDAVDEDGNKVGTYTLNPDGTVTFTPDEDYVGNPKPLELEGTAKNGKTARTTYTPHIVNPEIRDTASRTIYYTYETEDGEEVTDSVTQTVTIRKHPTKVDPKTGEVLEWGDWEPTKFPALENPDDKVDGKIWFTDDSVEEETVTSPGEKDDVHVVYKKIPYTVTYFDGDHGSSDGKGNQTDEDYGNEVTGGNGVTPDKGYKFTGKYTYVIKDRDGNVIGEGVTDDPTSITITGNIEFTPVYEKLPAYNINYDPNGGEGDMEDDNYIADEETMPDKDNEFTRKGYKYLGFYGYITDPTTGKETLIKDEKGNPILFTKAQDMIKYFEGMPDGTSIRMEAQWKKLPVVTYTDPATGRTFQKEVPFIDENTEPPASPDPTRDGYTFAGWERTVIYDENGDIVEVIYEATWVKNSPGQGEQGEQREQGEKGQGEKGQAEKKSEAAKTGDETNIAIWLGAAVISSLALAEIMRRRKLTRNR